MERKHIVLAILLCGSVGLFSYQWFFTFKKRQTDTVYYDLFYEAFLHGKAQEKEAEGLD